MPYHRLNILGIRDHEDLADELGGDWVHVTGSLHWAVARDDGRSAALDGSVHRLVGWGMRVDRLTPAQAVRELEPDLVIDPDAVATVYLVHRAGWLEPLAMAHGTLMAAAERYGAVLVRAEVVGFRTSGGTIGGVTLADGRELEADVVINAAGPDAGRIAALAGVRLPVDRTPGLLVVTGPAAARLGRVAYGPGVHLRPDGGGRVMIQRETLDGSAVEGTPPGLDDPPVREALDRAREIMPALVHVGIEAVRLGIRPVPRDGYPIVGFDPSVCNLYHAVTHSGVTLAARLALLVTEELTGGGTDALDPYRPDRFAAGGSAHPTPAAGPHE